MTGELREAKIVTGVDDHSRFCVMAKVVERATGRAVCLAFAQALARHGVPEEVITDNGKQFTDRFSRYGPTRGEVLFDKICRKNGITHRLTQPASPNQNGKVERFHGTFRPEISELGPFTSLEAAQAAVDAWVGEYNAERPHQGLDEKVPVVPADRFEPAAPAARSGAVGAALAEHRRHHGGTGAGPRPERSEPGDPVEVDKVVPASGNMTLCGNQFWLGPARAGRWCGSGSTVSGCTSPSVGSGSSRCARGSASTTWPSSPPRARSRPARLRCHHAAVREAAPDARSSRSSGPSPRPGPCRWDPGRPRRGDPRRPSGRDLYRGRRAVAVLRPPDA